MLRPVFAVSLALALVSSVSALTFTFDYRYDSEGFFSGENEWRRAHLEYVANDLSAYLGDTFSAIQPSGSNTYQQEFYHPVLDDWALLDGDAIAENEYRIYVGSAVLDEDILAWAGPGYWYSEGDDAFLADLDRGQGLVYGEEALDFGTWGGSMSFDSLRDWHFDDDPTTKEEFTGFDFYTVTLHELMHALGVGVSDSWYYQTDDLGYFHGEMVSRVFGPSLLSENGDHFDRDTFATNIYGDYQRAVITPYVSTNERRYLTAIDLAALADVGWEINPGLIPEPRTTPMLLGLAALGFALRRRRG